MKTWLKAFVLVSASSFAHAQDAGIAPPHDLTADPTDQDGAACLTCHTPFGEPRARSPLWVRQGELPGRGFPIVDTLSRTTAAGLEGHAGSVSLACLACHDGTQADATPGMETPVGLHSHAHPVGIEYARGRFGTQTRQAPDVNVFVQPLRPREEYHAPQQAEVDGQPVWWLGDDPIRRRENIQLYARTGQGRTVPYIECASCHDPHSPRENMLRQDGSRSAVCLSCHSM